MLWDSVGHSLLFTGIVSEACALSLTLAHKSCEMSLCLVGIRSAGTEFTPRLFYSQFSIIVQ